MSTESPERATVQARADPLLDDLRGWLATPSIGSELPLLHRVAAAAVHLWRLLGAQR